MEKNTNFFERLHVICETNGLKNLQELSKKLGYTSAEKLYRLERDPNAKPSFQMLMDLSNKFEYLDMNWLLTGVGDYKKKVITQLETQETNRISRLKTDTNVDSQAIPLYNIEASASIVSLFRDSRETKPVDFIQIPNLPKCDGAVYITGDSMYPLLKSGDIVMYKQIHNIDDGIYWGEMYLISVTEHGDEMVMVKYIKKSEKEGHIKLVSQNQHHQDRDISLKKVKALALIKASIRINSMS